MSSFSEAKLSEKLKNLNETQASIVGLSQWTLFHYRQAQRIAITWAQELSEAPVDKKLPLIYLANDVIQQARARRKNEFISAFGKVLFPSLSSAYKQVPVKIRAKIKRSVNVWKERHVLSDSVVRQILADFSKTDGVATGKGSINSASTSAGSGSTSPAPAPAAAPAAAVFAVPELEALNDRYWQSIKASQSAKSQLSDFEHQYNRLFAEDSNLPSPNVFHQQITDLLKVYDSLKASVEDSQSLRTQALQQLEQFVAEEKQKLREAGAFDKFETEHGLSGKVAKAVQTQRELQDMVDDGLVGGASAEEAAAPEFSPVSSPKPVSAQHELPNTNANTNTNIKNDNNENDSNENDSNENDNSNDNNNDSDDDAIPQYENNDSDDDDNDGDDSDNDQPSKKKKKIQENSVNDSASDTMVTDTDTNSNTNTAADGKALPNPAMTDASKLLEALKFIPNTNANNN